jgi:hypothetical protein
VFTHFTSRFLWFTGSNLRCVTEQTTYSGDGDIYQSVSIAKSCVRKPVGKEPLFNSLPAVMMILTNEASTGSEFNRIELIRAKKICQCRVMWAWASGQDPQRFQMRIWVRSWSQCSYAAHRHKYSKARRRTREIQELRLVLSLKLESLALSIHTCGSVNGSQIITTAVMMWNEVS